MPLRILRCPACAGTPMHTLERNTIEIDECPTCHGIWLDRGELEKLIVLSRAGHSLGAVLSPRDEDPELVSDDE